MPLKRGAPQGNQNRRKHGRYSAAAIAQRKLVYETLRKARCALEAARALQFDRVRVARDTEVEESRP